MSQQQQQEHRLGELLIEMGFLQQKELEDAVAMANQTRLPLGSVLVMSGHLSDKELRACVLGQSLLKDNVIVKEDMFQVMRIVRERGVSFEEGMQMLEGKVEKVDKETNKLGELLIAAERITAEQLQTALDTVESSGLPLGRVLVLTGAVNEPVLKVGLEVQVGVRDGSISREEAIQRLRTVTSGTSVTRQSIEMTAPTLDKILRLGEFFEKAGIISDTDMLNALEVALTQQRRVGEVLVQFNLVSEKMVEAALELQHLTRGRQIRPDQAVSALQNMHFNGMTLHQALGVPEPEAMFVRPEALYQPGPDAQAPMAVPAPAVPPPPPPPHPAPVAEDPNAVLLSGWGDESPAEEVRDGWGDQAQPPAQPGWGGDTAPAAPAVAPQPQAEPAQSAAPPTFAQPQQAPAAAPMQQFVTASGEYGAVAMGAAGQPQGLVPPPPPGYAPLPTQPISPQAYDQGQGSPPTMPPAMPPAPPVPAPAVMQGYEAPAGYTPLPTQPAAPVPESAVSYAQPAPSTPAPEAAPPSPAPEAAPPSPAPEAAPPSPPPEAAPASVHPEPVSSAAPAPVLPAAPPAAAAPQTRTAVDGVIAEIAFEAAQFAQAQESAAASAGGLGFEAVGLAQLLKVTGIVTQDEMDRAIKDVIRDSVLLHDILKSSGVGDPMTLRAAYDAHIMVIGGQLTFEHAMIALDYCKRGKLSLYESFKQLGWLQE
ncbi:MAG: hypothetical protein DKT66_24415 [Candidatus Melainabacteria bacterium]|nr:MAG: hypothetical protein DKT66_24415 [Candidatus Melainabacteria bacterium]